MVKTNDPIRICITSGKGGVGKTSFTVNLAFSLIERGQRVLVVDGDLGLANVDVLLGLPVRRTVRDVLEGAADPLDSVIYPVQDLGILPASSGAPEMVTLGPEEQAQLGGFLENISSHFDYILFDTAAGIGPSVLWFNNFANHSILVLTPDPTSITDAYALIKVLSRDYDKRLFYLIFNFVKNEQEGRQVFENLQKVARKFLNLELHYLGAIPEDTAVRKAVREQSPFVREAPNSHAARAVIVLADRILMLNENA